jgi:hypothetical protein
VLEELSNLPPSARAERYRELALEADRYAEKSSEAARQAYRLMAEQWRKLAEDLEGRR